MGDEVGRELGPAGVYDEAARDVIKRAHHCDFLGLPRRRHAQVSSAFAPGTGQIRMRERLAFVAVK